MFSKLKTLLVAGVVIASLPLLSTANKGQEKVTLCHNGHLITIARPAVQHHLDNHNRQGAKLTCFVVTNDRQCGGSSTQPPSCDPKPPKTPKPPKGDCPDGVTGCQ